MRMRDALLTQGRRKHTGTVLRCYEPSEYAYNPIHHAIARVGVQEGILGGR